MNTPSPFEQRLPGGTDSKSTLPGGAAPIKVGQQPETTPLTPTPAPTPLAPPAPLAPPVATPAAPAAPAQPAAAPAAAPAAEQQMVPAYVAKAMEKQHAKTAADHAMVAAPTPPTPNATPAPAAPARTAGPVPPATGTAASATEVAATGRTAPEQPAGTTLATDTAATAAAPADTTYTPPPDATPEQVTQLSSAAQTQAELMEQAKQWMTAKEDPAFVRQFNKTLLDTALQNQEAVNATKRAIAGNPSLAGQPAGDALLGLKAIQLGMNLSDLKATMSVEHARAVADLNKRGFDAVYALNRDKMTQDDKDVETYGSVMDRMISEGADDATLEAYFNKNVKPLLGDKDISFSQFRSPAERNKILSGVQTDGLEQMREALDRGDTAGALDALEASYAPAKQVELGAKLIADNDVDTINKWLKDAGYDEIESAADLIGREDDVFIAQQISKGKAKIGESPLQPQVDALLRTLQGKGMDITDPDTIDAVEEYIYQQNFGDPEQPNVLPWESDATSYKYKDWEIFNPNTGTVVDAGGELYDPQDNPEPTSGPAYEWRNALDGAWQKYLVANPDSKSRLSRDDWFAKVKKDYLAMGKPDVTIKDFLEGQGDAAYNPGPAVILPENRPAAQAEGERTIKNAKTFAEVDWTDPNVAEYVAQLDNLVPSAINKDWVNANLGKTVRIDGKVYKVKALYNVGGGKKNDGAWLESQDGTQIYMDRNGKTEEFATDRYI